MMIPNYTELATVLYDIEQVICYVLLAQIGWGRFSVDTDTSYSTIKKCLNCLIPTLIVTLITVGFAAQEILCFNRSQVSLHFNIACFHNNFYVHVNASSKFQE